MNAYYKKRDPGRLVHYEGVFQNRDYEDTISDVESQMYAPPGRVREYLENEPKKPFILCEYMHDMFWSSIFVTLMANKIGGLQFGIYRNCQISSRVFHTAVAALPLTKANRSDFE